ncbi:MAG TPA: peptidoglycan editing factor PgeF [Methylococcaceae bacterium]|nr:peptidoglycan editing factor PgeF [Methylococcaceae bacterium]
MSAGWLIPDWPAPANVRAVCTTRVGGCSRGMFAGLNLAAHVGDDPEDVAYNRAQLRSALQLPGEPAWLEQVHGTQATDASRPEPRRADAGFTRTPGVVCAVLTADCLPVLLCDAAGSRVAAVHAGWRGLAAGVLENAVAALDGSRLMAWLGPAIGPQAFEVGAEVHQAFVAAHPECAAAFSPAEDGKWRADLYRLARRALHRAGVNGVHGGGWCTYSEPERFFSYRRDGATGRMASLIWLNECP